ncbi:MAG: class I SAM-dependent methyltransferase [Ignavibacteriae bacterium]|nr:class I SAM-dependent methyltransferase [Ignavibacteriota bacterium]
MSKEWFEDWFSSKEYLEVYKHRNSEDAERLLELILNNISIEPDAKILDAACGAGRHSIYLAEKDFNVTGFDLSSTLLKIANENSKHLKLDINFINSDIRQFSSKTNFDLIVNLFTSFGYFDSDEENFAFPSNAFDILNESGYFVLDFLNKNYVIKTLVPESEKRIGDKIITEKRKIENSRVVKTIIINEDSKISEYFESVKLYSSEVILDKFSEIGFKIKSIFGSYSGNDFVENKSERFIVIFQK